MKIRNRITFFLLLICILSTVSVTIANYKLFYSSLEETVEENIQGKAENVAKEIDKWLAEQKYALIGVVDDLVYHNNFEYDYVYEILRAQSEKHLFSIKYY